MGTPQNDDAIPAHMLGLATTDDLEDVGDDLADRLDAIRANQDRIIDRLDRLVEAQDTLAERLTGERATRYPEYPWNWSTSVPADTKRADPHETVVEIDRKGVIETLYIGWSDASQQAVGVQFRGPDGEKLVPRNKGTQAEFLAMNDHVLEFNLNFEFEAGSQFTAAFINADENHPHYCNVVGVVADHE